MTPGFNNQPVQVSSLDGRNVTFIAALLFVMRDGRTVRVRPGARSDGASIPRGLWWLLAPFGKYWRAALLHDAAYQLTLEFLVGIDWVPLNLTEREANQLIYEAMCDLGDGWWTRHIIYWALVLFGKKAYNDDRNKIV